MPLYSFTLPCPEPRQWNQAARNEEQRATVLQAQRKYADAALRWREACGIWDRVGERERAEWCLYNAGGCEIELDPEFQRLQAAGQVVTVPIGTHGPAGDG